MKRITLLLIGLLTLPFFSYSGGIVTNQNQSASYIRMFARDASTDIDAVFFNPAGLTKLDDGLYLSLNYQYINQNKFVTSNYVNLNNSPVEYKGQISVPVFPGVYAAYKTGKFVFSFAWNPVGGGGGATFENGLPSFEIPISDLKLGGASDYGLDAYFEGSSVYWGYQFGVSYEINDMFSLYLGGRYVTAKNTYMGHLKDITITQGAYEGSASAYYQNIVNFADGLSGLSALGYGSLTLEQLSGSIPAEDYQALAAGYAGFGLDPTVVTIDQASAGVDPYYYPAKRSAYMTSPQDDVEVEQTGSGFAPIIGVNYSPSDKLNIGLKYEFMTKIEMKNNTTKDFILDYDPVSEEVTRTMFPDGSTFRSDMPALLSVGADYQINEKLSVAGGFHMYFDKAANYGRKLYDPDLGRSVYVDNDEVIDNNSTEFALGFEYMLSDKLLLSIGYLNTQTGVSQMYQTDLSYSNNSNTVGLGGAYAVTSNIDFNLGVGYTTYNDAKKIYNVYNAEGTPIPTIERYDKDNFFIALGLDFKFGKKSE